MRKNDDLWTSAANGTVDDNETTSELNTKMPTVISEPIQITIQNKTNNISEVVKNDDMCV